MPVARTLPGAFLDLVVSAAESGFAPPELMALLKHPLTLAGRAPGDIRKAARALERAAFRDIYIGQGLDGVADAVKAARSEERRRMPVSEQEQETALSLVEDLKRAFAPLTAVFQDPSPQAASRLAEAHGAAAEHQGQRQRQREGEGGGQAVRRKGGEAGSGHGNGPGWGNRGA